MHSGLLMAGKRVIVTGAARGIGAEISAGFAAHGAAVALLDLDLAAATETAERITQANATAGARAFALGCDVSDEGSVEAAVAESVARLGGLDVLVNNAGIVRDASLRTMTADDFDSVIGVHLRGGWLAIRAAARVLKPAGRGAIVSLSSLSGKVGGRGQTNYSAAKAGLVGLTKSAAKELGPRGIRVNAVQPGLIRTPMTEALPPEVFAELEASVPLGRAGTPAEVAQAVLFLASEQASYITGAVLEVGGGRSM